MSSADNHCKQFESRSGPTKCRARSWSKLFDTLMVFLKDFFKEVDFEKNQQRTKNHEKFPIGRVKHQIIGNKHFLGYIPAFRGCEQQRCRPACTNAQSDQRLCYLLIGKYQIYTCHKRNFTFLTSLCSWAGLFGYDMVGDPEDRFLILRPTL